MLHIQRVVVSHGDSGIDVLFSPHLGGFVGGQLDGLREARTLSELQPSPAVLDDSEQPAETACEEIQREELGAGPEQQESGRRGYPDPLNAGPFDPGSTLTSITPPGPGCFVQAGNAAADVLTLRVDPNLQHAGLSNERVQGL